MDELQVRPLDEAGARAVLAWRYAPPYDVYSIESEVPEAEIAFLTDPANGYYRLDDASGELAAFCCFGHDARVTGGAYEGDALDIGLGVRPDLTGRGLGAGIAAQVVAFAERTFAPAGLRVTVMAWNRRALRVWERQGFAQTETFRARYGGDEYVVLTR